MQSISYAFSFLIILALVGCVSSSDDDNDDNGEVSSPVMDVGGSWLGFIAPSEDAPEIGPSNALAYELELGPEVNGVYEGSARVIDVSDELTFPYRRFDVRARVEEGRLLVEQLEFETTGSNLRSAVDARSLECERTLTLAIDEDGEALTGMWDSPECGRGDVTLERPPEEPEEEQSSLWHEQLPNCPCRLLDALAGEAAEDAGRRAGTWSSIKRAGGIVDLLTAYHPGASFEVRWSLDEGSGSGQQCTYDADRRLITGGLGAGTPDLIAPRGAHLDTLRHRRVDVLPFRDDDPRTRISCATYLERRPPNVGDSCDALVIGALPSEENDRTCKQLIDDGLVTADDSSSNDLVELEDDTLSPVPASYNDPHLVTIDGVGYDFQAVGEFVLVESTLPGLVIQARQVQYGGVGSAVSVNAGFAFDVSGNELSIVLSSDRSLFVHVDGELQTAGELVEFSGGGAIRQEGSLVSVLWPDGSIAAIVNRGQFLNLSLALAENHAGEVSGLLGNFDGERANDLATRDGQDLSIRPDADVLYGAFAEGWRVSDETSLFVYAEGESTEDFTDRLVPGRVVSIDDLDESQRRRASAICTAAGVTKGLLFDNCVLDVGLTDESDFAPALADVQDALAEEPDAAEIRGEIDVPTLLCGTRPGNEMREARYEGTFTNPDSGVLWNATLDLGSCDNDVVGSMRIVGDGRFQRRRFVGTLEQGTISLEAGFPVDFDGLPACRDMTISLVESGTALTGSWEASNCPQGGAIDLERIDSVEPAAFLGTWSGIATQGLQTYPVLIQLAFDDGYTSGTIDYPTLPCSGTLGPGQFDGATLSLPEALTSPGSCALDGTVDLRAIDTDSLSYEWYGEGRGVSVTATLTRER